MSSQDLMNSAFSPVSGTGKFFQQAQEEGRMRKRSETANRIVENEKQYVRTLEIIFKVDEVTAGVLTLRCL